MIESYHRGFTLIEIMIVVVILSLLLSVAIPNYFKSHSMSKTTVCKNNLKQITGAVEQWALDNNIPGGTVPNDAQEAQIYADYMRGGKPECPGGGQYIIYAVGANPQVRCTLESEGHKLTD